MKVARQHSSASGTGGSASGGPREPSRRGRTYLFVAIVCLGLGYLWLRDLTSSKPVEDSAAVSKASPKPRVKRTVNLTLSRTPTPRPEPSITPAPPMVGMPMPPMPVVIEEEAPSQPPSQKIIMVSVIDSNGKPVERALVDSEDCGFFRQAFGGAVAIETTEDACTVQASRRDGALMAWSDPVYVDLTGEAEVSITLELPAERTAGMGLQVAKDDAGIRVLGVIPGSPAEKAGLIPGDLVTVVDGVQTAGLSVREFVELGTGPLGTEVSISVERETENAKSGLELTLVRQLIEFPR